MTRYTDDQGRDWAIQDGNAYTFWRELLHTVPIMADTKLPSTNWADLSEVQLEAFEHPADYRDLFLNVRRTLFGEDDDS